ncbi:MAG TPA: cyclic pyranopterin monophosphate synthase MoaC [Actinomycetota bacterium]|nr:cyclic pyranopterin monophosphate synthase MoaC [Actinomycetota bacterium]
MNERDPAARIVDVGAKDVTVRKAEAAVAVELSAETCRRLMEGTPKGDPIEAARIAGLMAVKRTPDLLPFCHPVAITGAEVRVEVRPEEGRVDIRAAVTAADRTGVEMEALTACAVAALSVYDTAKAHERSAVITGLRLVRKSGGRSGDFRAGGVGA